MWHTAFDQLNGLAVSNGVPYDLNIYEEMSESEQTGEAKRYFDYEYLDPSEKQKYKALKAGEQKEKYERNWMHEVLEHNYNYRERFDISYLDEEEKMQYDKLMPKEQYQYARNWVDNLVRKKLIENFDPKKDLTIEEEKYYNNIKDDKHKNQYAISCIDKKFNEKYKNYAKGHLRSVSSSRVANKLNDTPGREMHQYSWNETGSKAIVFGYKIEDCWRFALQKQIKTKVTDTISTNDLGEWDHTACQIKKILSSGLVTEEDCEYCLDNESKLQDIVRNKDQFSDVNEKIMLYKAKKDNYKNNFAVHETALQEGEQMNPELKQMFK